MESPGISGVRKNNKRYPAVSEAIFLQTRLSPPVKNLLAKRDISCSISSVSSFLSQSKNEKINDNKRDKMIFSKDDIMAILVVLSRPYRSSPIEKVNVDKLVTERMSDATERKEEGEENNSTNMDINLNTNKSKNSTHSTELEDLKKERNETNKFIDTVKSSVENVLQSLLPKESLAVYRLLSCIPYSTLSLVASRSLFRSWDVTIKKGVESIDDMKRLIEIGTIILQKETIKENRGEFNELNLLNVNHIETQTDKKDININNELKEIKESDISHLLPLIDVSSKLSDIIGGRCGRFLDISVAVNFMPIVTQRYRTCTDEKIKTSLSNLLEGLFRRVQTSSFVTLDQCILVSRHMSHLLPITGGKLPFAKDLVPFVSTVSSLIQKHKIEESNISNTNTNTNDTRISLIHRISSFTRHSLISREQKIEIINALENSDSFRSGFTFPEALTVLDVIDSEYFSTTLSGVIHGVIFSKNLDRMKLHGTGVISRNISFLLFHESILDIKTVDNADENVEVDSPELKKKDASLITKKDKTELTKIEIIRRSGILMEVFTFYKEQMPTAWISRVLEIFTNDSLFSRFKEKNNRIEAIPGIFRNTPIRDKLINLSKCLLSRGLSICRNSDEASPMEKHLPELQRLVTSSSILVGWRDKDILSLVEYIVLYAENKIDLSPTNDKIQLLPYSLIKMFLFIFQEITKNLSNDSLDSLDLKTRIIRLLRNCNILTVIRDEELFQLTNELIEELSKPLIVNLNEIQTPIELIVNTEPIVKLMEVVSGNKNKNKHKKRKDDTSIESIEQIESIKDPSPLIQTTNEKLRPNLNSPLSLSEVILTRSPSVLQGVITGTIPSSCDMKTFIIDSIIESSFSSPSSFSTKKDSMDALTVASLLCETHSSPTYLFGKDKLLSFLRSGVAKLKTEIFTDEYGISETAEIPMELLDRKKSEIITDDHSSIDKSDTNKDRDTVTLNSLLFGDHRKELKVTGLERADRIYTIAILNIPKNIFISEEKRKEFVFVVNDAIRKEIIDIQEMFPLDEDEEFKDININKETKKHLMVARLGKVLSSMSMFAYQELFHLDTGNMEDWIVSIEAANRVFEDLEFSIERFGLHLLSHYLLWLHVIRRLFYTPSNRNESININDINSKEIEIEKENSDFNDKFDYQVFDTSQSKGVQPQLIVDGFKASSELWRSLLCSHGDLFFMLEHVIAPKFDEYLRKSMTSDVLHGNDVLLPQLCSDPHLIFSIRRLLDIRLLDFHNKKSEKLLQNEGDLLQNDNDTTAYIGHDIHTNFRSPGIPICVDLAVEMSNRFACITVIEGETLNSEIISSSSGPWNVRGFNSDSKKDLYKVIPVGIQKENMVPTVAPIINGHLNLISSLLRGKVGDNNFRHFFLISVDGLSDIVDWLVDESVDH